MCVAQNIISLACSFIGNVVCSHRSSVKKNAPSCVFWVFLFLDKPTSEGRALIFSGTNYNYNWWIFVWLTVFLVFRVSIVIRENFVFLLLYIYCNLVIFEFNFLYSALCWFPYFTVTLVNKIHRCWAKLFFVTQ